MARKIGPYEVIKRLAVGGSAEIFLARKGGLLGFEQHYALKVLLSHYSDDEDHRKMMIDEARLTSQLDHPNIVKVHDLGEDGGDLYMVMEYVHGLNVAQLLARLNTSGRRMPIEVGAFIAQEICAGLHYAHTRRSMDGNHLRLVHRDVSPQNVLLGFGGEVKLIDFGVAKAAVGGRLETKTGIIKGKLTYMAPEYAVGSLQDHRSDVFSAGLCLYEMVTGKAAYDITEPRELIEAVKHARIARPSRFREDIPNELEKIIEKALEENLVHRWETARAMQEELTRLLSQHAPNFTKEKLSAWFMDLRDASGPRVDSAGSTSQGLPVARDEVAESDPDPGLSTLNFEDEGATNPESESVPTEELTPDDVDTDEIEGAKGRMPGKTGPLERVDGPPEKVELLGLRDLSALENQETPPPEEDDVAVLETMAMEAHALPEAAPEASERAEAAPEPAKAPEPEPEQPKQPANDPPKPEMVATAEPDEQTFAGGEDGIRIQRDFPVGFDDVAQAPTSDIEVAIIAPERGVSELPTATNIDVDRIRGDDVPKLARAQPQIMTPSGFQRQLTPAEIDSIRSGSSSTTDEPSSTTDEPAPRNQERTQPLAPVSRETSPAYEILPTDTASAAPSEAELANSSEAYGSAEPSMKLSAPVIVEDEDAPTNVAMPIPGAMPIPEASADVSEELPSFVQMPDNLRHGLKPGTKKSDRPPPGLTPPSSDQPSPELKASATSIVKKLGDTYNGFSKTEKGRRTTDAAIAGVLAVIFLIIVFYVFFIAD